ncbi:50S ribosomal protein L13 [Candidatus Poribacteria bacterium]|nr:50S ribosomal protein L13 [Candidatus Poribacteria bacterium]
MKTYIPKAESINKKWYVVDAKGKTLGRLATKVAAILRGKHKPDFTPHMDVGDYVIVVNAEKVQLTGRKSQQKMYYNHSGYPGGIKEISYTELLNRKPEQVVTIAVKGMLPHNKLGRKITKHLKVYSGPDHPHNSQKPEPLQI